MSQGPCKDVVPGLGAFRLPNNVLNVRQWHFPAILCLGILSIPIPLDLVFHVNLSHMSAPTFCREHVASFDLCLTQCPSPPAREREPNRNLSETETFPFCSNDTSLLLISFLAISPFISNYTQLKGTESTYYAIHYRGAFYIILD